MKRFAFVFSISLCCVILSCTQHPDDVDPDALSKLAKCPLRNVNSDKGDQLLSFEYTLSRIKRIVIRDSVEVAATFTYNNKNQIEKMLITTDNTGDYTVVFEYDASGKIIKSKTSVEDYQFMTNDFTYEGTNITAITTQFDIFGDTVGGKTRVEYTGGNVSRVYTRIDGFPELLTFEGTTYDDKPQFMPDGYRTMAMGFVGIANNFFAAFGKNNPKLVKIFDDNGKLTETTQTEYEYDKIGIVTRGTQTMTNADNVKTIRNMVYNFVCL